MLDAIITSKTRIKLLLKFFLNPYNLAHLRGLAKEFDESSNAIRIELNRLADAGMLNVLSQGNKKLFQVNIHHPLYHAINLIMKQYSGIDSIIDNILRGLGNLNKVYLGGDFAKGIESNVIDIVLVGNIDKNYLLETIEKAEKATGKKIKYLTFTTQEESNQVFMKEDFVLVYEANK
jgi:hypothetical protein